MPRAWWLEHEPDRVLLREGAFEAEDAGGEEAGAVGERRQRARVDVQGPVRDEGVEQPEVARADWIFRRQEARVERVGWGGVGGDGGCAVEVLGRGGEARRQRFGVSDDLGDVARPRGAGDDGGDAGGGGEARGDDLGRHAARAEGGAGRRHVGREAADVGDDGDRLRVRVAARILVVQAVDVRHQEEVVGIDHGGRDGG
ncbi:hypothetical protein GJ744_008724 [Endocarpon pusillum]|uniref:Uncharacterized protein n=1 Tax=Endocarpon pusillum TaxID=364733 RepID=A0A8H7E9F7_9EURO|nr:hypothetical protein GJ744_008724 [Endocarpon pusillum]